MSSIDGQNLPSKIVAPSVFKSTITKDRWLQLLLERGRYNTSIFRSKRGRLLSKQPRKKSFTICSPWRQNARPRRSRGITESFKGQGCQQQQLRQLQNNNKNFLLYHEGPGSSSKNPGESRKSAPTPPNAPSRTTKNHGPEISKLRGM